MRASTFFYTLLGGASTAAAIGVTGAAEGFAKGVTGGGSAYAVYPSTTAELVSYLSDSAPRVIVLTKTFDFTGTEGTTTATGCAPWGTGSACQTAINKNNWCKNYASSAPATSVTYDNAGLEGMTVASDKTLIGQGSTGIIKGKGLRIVSGAKNIIIQNIHITNLNPQYVWGGDAITIDNADMVWIDHVTTSLIGRQHIVLGTEASNRVTISNHFLDGTTTHSASCDGHHYWAMYFTGSSDQITMKGNYIYKTSGRAPKVQGNTLLHAVNNYWKDNTGHAFEISSGAYVVAEGNVFENVVTIAETPEAGSFFSSPDATTNAVCTSSLGHACKLNKFISSGSISQTKTNFLSDFSGKSVANASSNCGVAASVVASAGFGKI